MNIIITGASRGIGKELTRLFTKQPGHKLFLISRNKQKLELLINECKTVQPYAKIFALPFDLENTHNIHSLIPIINEEVNSIDILINNAGFLINKPFNQTTHSDIEHIYKVNVLAPIELIKCLIPLFEKSESAHIVNIGSMGGYQGSVKFPGLAGYASSKAAIAGLTECLAEEYKNSNIKFNCLSLGAVATEMLAEAFPGYKAPTTALEMAVFIHDFALNGHKMFNGKIIPVSKTTP